MTTPTTHQKNLRRRESSSSLLPHHLDFLSSSLLFLLLLLLLVPSSGGESSSDNNKTPRHHHDDTTDTTSTIVNVADLFHHLNTVTHQLECNDCHRFDGIGGISGGGATSRLLVDYPPDVQSEVLDFLFKPNFGASLHLLKVEIGGDAQSTDGSETCHMHAQNDLNLHRGYEWYMLKEAKKRNPNILTYGLPWSFPGWVSTDNNKNNHKRNPFHNMDLVTNYTLQWMLGARDVHNITIDYLGVWNEIGTNRDYLLAIRKVLDNNGFQNTKLVSNDGGPQDFLPHLVNDTTYRNTIDVLGFHYPDDHDNVSWAIANNLENKPPIWASEESSSYNDYNGAACWARVLASHYVINNMTAAIMWNLVGSYMHGTNWYGSSMFVANQPWTGYYEYDKQMPVVWATAHYTQFIQPGWQFLPVGKGSGELKHGGYYLTLVSPTLEYFTLIVVKISRDHAACTRPKLWDWNTTDETFQISIQLPHPSNVKDIQTWYSNFEQKEPRLFEKLHQERNGLSQVLTSTQHRISGRKGTILRSFDITLNVTIGSVFTVTNQPTGVVGNKGQSTIHKTPNASFPLPYVDDFSSNYNCTNCYAKYLSDQMGAFEIQDVAGGGRALTQMTPQLPITWWQVQKDRGPVSLIGMTEWEDTEVEITFRLPDPSTAACIASRTDQFWSKGVTCCANSTTWFMSYGGANLTGFDPTSENAIAHGTHSLAIKSSWQKMTLGTLGNHVYCGINDDKVVDDKEIRWGDSGFVAIGTNAYAPIQFQRLAINPIGDQWNIDPPTLSPPPPVGFKNTTSRSRRTLQQQKRQQQQQQPPTTTGDAIAGATADSWSLSFSYCTPNGLSHQSEQFDLTSNWQLLHLPSGLCVTVVKCDDDDDDEPKDYRANGERQRRCHHDNNNVKTSSPLAMTSGSLVLAECQHDYEPQQFRHKYTTIRNGSIFKPIPLTNELGDLCATAIDHGGKVSLEMIDHKSRTRSCAGESQSTPNSYYSKWSLYPNTHQLRNAFGYNPWLNGKRAMCLKAIQNQQTTMTATATA